MIKRTISLLLCIVLAATLLSTGASATNSFTKTDNIAQNMVNAALAQQGLKRADFASDGMPNDQWCAYFICWLSRHSGASDAGLLPGSYSSSGTTGSLIKYAANHSTGTLYYFTDAANTWAGKSLSATGLKNSVDYRNKRSSYTPKAGDLIFFKWAGSTSGTFNHVGLVYNVDSSKVYYVDGNGVSGCTKDTSYVKTHTLSRTSTEIAAYVHVNYGGTVSSSLSIAGTGTSNMTSTAVRLNGSCTYVGSRPSSVGLLFGTSSGSLSKKDSDVIDHNKNPFDIWYDLSGLKTGTRYYWQLYAVVDGKTINEASVHSFVAGGGAETTEKPSTTFSVKATTNCKYYITVSANFLLQCYETPTSNTNYRKFNENDTSYNLVCYQKLDMSDGSVRYKVTDGSGNVMYFIYSSKLSVTVAHNYTTHGWETAHPHREMDICTCGYIYYGATSLEEGCSQCYPEDEKPTVETYSVEFNANGGVCDSEGVMVEKGATYGTLPTPTRKGYKFDGWYTSATGGSKVTSSTVVSLSGDQTLYAQWTEEEKELLLLMFNANGGSCSIGSKGVYNEEEYGTLPTPTREGYSFDGWYTAATGGSKITATTIVTKTVDHFVYAHWTQSDGEGRIVMTLGSPNISIDGQSTKIDAQGTVPVIRNDRTLLPVRAVIEAMGGEVTWSAASRTATLKRNGKTLFLQINNAVAWDADGATYALDAAPVIINDRTLLPLRMIAEYFGAKVSWDAATRSATISYTK